MKDMLKDKFYPNPLTHKEEDMEFDLRRHINLPRMVKRVQVQIHRAICTLHRTHR